MPTMFDSHVLASLAIPVVVLALFTRAWAKAADGSPRGTSGAARARSVTLLNRIGWILTGLLDVTTTLLVVALIGATLWFGYLCFAG